MSSKFFTDLAKKGNGGGEGKHGILYRVPTVYEALYKVPSQQQALEALQWPLSISTLR